jgi:peptidase M42 family hydrolase
MVKTIDDDGRLGVVPVGQWSSRFAEGARVTVVSDDSALPGTIVPLKDSGHAYDDDVDRLPVSWSNVEVRVDAPCDSRQAARDLGIRVGDYVTIDPRSEFLANGYVNSRHLDDKAGVATLLAMARAVVTSSVTLPVDCHLLFTISEEVGSGASHVLHGDVAEMVAIDNGVVGPEQNTSARGVTLCMMDSSGPFDYHLTRKLIALCEDLGIEHERDIFTHYRCDAASAVDAGNDLRTALVCYGLDASHGHERVHLDSLRRVAELLAAYVQSPPTFTRDQHELAPIKQGFSRQPDASPDVPAAPVEEEA